MLGSSQNWLYDNGRNFASKLFPLYYGLFEIVVKQIKVFYGLPGTILLHFVFSYVDLSFDSFFRFFRFFPPKMFDF